MTRTWMLALAAALACKTTSPGDNNRAADAGDEAEVDAGESCALPPGATGGKRLRLVYLVPSDKEADPARLASLQGAMRDVQLWLSARMPDGTSFRVSEPAVEVAAVAHASDYYRTNDPGGAPQDRFWSNSLTDAFAATGGMFDDPDNVWLYYIDADAGCGQVGAGANTHLALFGANDLRGLMNETRVPACEGEELEPLGRCRFVGGLAVLAFYAIGIPAPAGCSDGDDATACPEEAITWLGYTTYPDAELIDENVEQALENPFVRAIGLPDCQLDCAVVPTQ